MTMAISGSSSLTCPLRFVLHLLLIFPTITIADQKYIILHTSDLHSKFEQVNKYGGVCSEKDQAENACYGGFARIKTKINEIRNANQGTPIIVMDAGDFYHGTLHFTIHKAQMVTEMMSFLTFDYGAVGDQEFDDGVKGLVPFMTGSKHQLFAANLEKGGEPAFQTLAKDNNFLHAGTFQDSKVSGVYYSVLGFTLMDMEKRAKTANLSFSDTVVPLTTYSEKYPRHPKIALGHITDFEDAKRIAEEVDSIDVIVASNGNSFLYNGKPPGQPEVPIGPYPYMANNSKTGRAVPIVNAYENGKYLGYLELTVDGSGYVKSAIGNPILLNSTVAEDPTVLAALEKWKVAGSKEIVGVTNSHVVGSRRCGLRECSMGNLITDAMVEAVSGKSRRGVRMAVINAGRILGSFPAGEITLEQAANVLPFEDTYYMVSMTGVVLKRLFEHAVSNYKKESEVPEFLQITGLRVLYDLNGNPGYRVKSIRTLCKGCRYYVPLDRKENYSIIMNSYIAEGYLGYNQVLDRDEHSVTKARPKEVPILDMLITYLRDREGLTVPARENRICFVSDQDCNHNSEEKSGGNLLRIDCLPFLSIFYLHIIVCFILCKHV